MDWQKLAVNGMAAELSIIQLQNNINIYEDFY